MSGAPKQTPPVPPPPPIRQTGEETARENEEVRKKQAKRQGYAATMSPQRGGSMFSMSGGTPKKSLLG